MANILISQFKKFDREFRNNFLNDINDKIYLETGAQIEQIKLQNKKKM
jgi:hypothetical protein